MTEQLWVSAAINLFKMVGELHRKGFQHLRICPYEYPLAWRLCIGPKSKFSTKNGAFLEHAWGEYPVYSSAQKQECFGWQEAGDYSPEGLAQLFAKRFCEVCEAGRGRDWEYAGWLTLNLSAMSAERACCLLCKPSISSRVPEDLNFLPLKSYEPRSKSPNLPSAAFIALSFQGLVEERDSLRHSLVNCRGSWRPRNSRSNDAPRARGLRTTRPRSPAQSPPPAPAGRRRSTTITMSI